MTKLPEPYSTVGGLLGEVGTFAAMGYMLRRGDGLYIEEQLQSYGDARFNRALELAAQTCHTQATTRSNHDYVNSAIDCADAIRALIKEQT